MELWEFVRSLSDKRMQKLPEKVWRVVMLYVHGLPVTNYLVIETVNRREEFVFSELKKELELSPFGLVLRTVTAGDAKYQPYYWVREPDEITQALAKLGGNSFLLAFAPQTDPTDPQKVKGFTVGRYALGESGWRKVEYCKDETRHRVLERMRRGDSRFGVLTKEPGSFFRPSPGSDSGLNLAILRCLLPHDDCLHHLKESVERFRNRRAELCLEFKFNGTSIAFHDFDY